jgi:DNA-binding MurR/RpiR family transcriptional regulator
MKTSELIRERFTALSPVLQKAGKFVLDHPNEVVISSMRTIAAKALVPPATLVRFAQALGYAGWPDLKHALAIELGLAQDPYSQRAKNLIERGGFTQEASARHMGADAEAELLDELFETQQSNLHLTKSRNGDVLRRAAALLVGGAKVHVAGFRASFPLAFQLVYVYRLFRPTVHLVDAQAGVMEMQLRALEAGDTVVVVSFAPYSSEAKGVAVMARQRGCQVVAITDSIASPLSLLADETLLFSVESPSFFPSITAGMALVEALLELVVTQSGVAVVQRIDAAESQLFASGAYLQPPKLNAGRVKA